MYKEQMTHEPTERLAVRPYELAQLLGVSRAYAYELVRTGAIGSLRTGRAILVPLTAVHEFLARSGTGTGDGRADEEIGDGRVLDEPKPRREQRRRHKQFVAGR
jgi:excisionase family DNA binding protein